MDNVAGQIGYPLIDDLLGDPNALQARVLQVIEKELRHETITPLDSSAPVVASSVMFLLGQLSVDSDSAPEICIILNKRSKAVRQSGDLCCPGGTVEAQIDPRLAKLLLLPGSPLRRWPLWSEFSCKRPREARILSLLLATALRESWEEMRLNPFGVRFFGPLPSERLLLFKRIIYPMVGWVRRQRHFKPSWEVAKILAIPLRSLLDPVHYANYRLYVPPRVEQRINRKTQDLPCFLHRQQNHTEILWGATYRIVVHFMELLFGFKPPDISTLPMVPGVMDENYI
jgi:hypothetical protein